MNNIKSEREFENYIRTIIEEVLKSTNSEVYCLESKKAVDILICDDRGRTKINFIEVKYHTKSHGRIGIGSKSGTGIQPEILKKQPKYFLNNLRFVISGEESDKIHFTTIEEICEKYISGNKIGAKFNNIKTCIFKENRGFSEDEFKQELKNWLYI